MGKNKRPSREKRNGVGITTPQASAVQKRRWRALTVTCGNANRGVRTEAGPAEQGKQDMIKHEPWTTPNCKYAFEMRQIQFKRSFAFRQSSVKKKYKTA